MFRNSRPFLIDQVKSGKVGLAKSTQPAGAANEANPPEEGLMIDKPELDPADKKRFPFDNLLPPSTSAHIHQSGLAH